MEIYIMNKSITAIRVHALSIYAETSTGDYIDIIISGQLADDVAKLKEFGCEYNYEGGALYLEWDDADLMTTISWTFTINKNTGWFEGK